MKPLICNFMVFTQSENSYMAMKPYKMPQKMVKRVSFTTFSRVHDIIVVPLQPN
jgi:hypothetical protein